MTTAQGLLGSAVLCAVVVAKIMVAVWRVGTERLARRAARDRLREGQRT